MARDSGANRRVAGPREAALEFVSTAPITAATTLVVLALAAGYDYIISVEAFAQTDDAQILWLRFSDDGGATYEADAGDYPWSIVANGTSNLNASDTRIRLSGGTGMGNDAGNTSTLEITLINPNASSEQATCFWLGHVMDESATPVLFAIHGAARFIQGADAVDAIQLLWSGGSTFKAQGDITVRRRKRS